VASPLWLCHRYEGDDQGSKVEDRHWHQKSDMHRLRDPTSYLSAQYPIYCAIARCRRGRVGGCRIYEPQVRKLGNDDIKAKEVRN